MPATLPAIVQHDVTLNALQRDYYLFKNVIWCMKDTMMTRRLVPVLVRVPDCLARRAGWNPDTGERDSDILSVPPWTYFDMDVSTWHHDYIQIETSPEYGRFLRSTDAGRTWTLIKQFKSKAESGRHGRVRTIEGGK